MWWLPVLGVAGSPRTVLVSHPRPPFLRAVVLSWQFPSDFRPLWILREVGEDLSKQERNIVAPTEPARSLSMLYNRLLVASVLDDRDETPKRKKKTGSGQVVSCG